MKYSRIIAAVTETVWAITEEKLTAIVEFLQLKADGGTIDLDQMASFEPPRLEAATHTATTSGTHIAVIPIRGIISHRMNMLSAFSGGTSTEETGQVFAAAVNDPKIGTIVLDIDSPGGNVVGIQELSDQIFAARDRVRIVAVANSMAASAAYFIGSQAHEFSVMPSGSVGSIGVLAIHQAMFDADSKERKRVTMLKAGRFKGESNPFEPLSADAQAAAMKAINVQYNVFIAHVARGRGVSEDVVRNGFGEGRIVHAVDAYAESMVDRIETMNEVIARLVVNAQSTSSATTTATVEDIVTAPSGMATLGDVPWQFIKAGESSTDTEDHMKAKIDRKKLSTEECAELDRLQALNVESEPPVAQIDASVIEGLPQEVQDRLRAQDTAIASAQGIAEQAKTEAAVERKAREAREANDEARTLFPNLPGTAEEKGSMLQSIRAIDDDDTVKGIISRLQAGDTAIKSLMDEQGHSDAGFGSAYEEMESKAKALMVDNKKLTKAKAIAQIAQSDGALYARFQAEKSA